MVRILPSLEFPLTGMKPREIATNRSNMSLKIIKKGRKSLAANSFHRMTFTESYIYCYVYLMYKSNSVKPGTFYYFSGRHPTNHY